MSTDAINFHLDFCYEGEEKPAIVNQKGSIAAGKCIVLCGSSGCGKSTLLRCMNHLVPGFYEGKLNGFCQMEGEPINEKTIGEVGEIAASVFQDPRSQFFTVNSSTEVAFGLENFGMTQEEIEKRVNQAFTLFGLEKLKDRSVFQLSSGERQLIAILSAWAMDARIFLLDEPTANLDFNAVEKLKDLLSQLKEQGKTIIISEHRLYYMRDIADEYWRIENGVIEEKIDAKMMKQYSEAQLRELGLRVVELKQIVPVVEKKKVHVDYMHKLEVKDLGFAYGRNGREILKDVSLKAQTGEVIGLIGNNGCGKTTFGKCITGLLKKSSGEILLNGVVLDKKLIVRKSMFVMQEAEFQFFTNSVMGELRYGRKPSKELDEQIELLLKEFDMWKCRNKHPFSLSGGQMQKLTLMMAYLSEKPIVVLDEPTAGLDSHSLEVCIGLIEKMRRNKIVLIITHDMELIAKVCSRCVKIENKSIQREFDLQRENQFYEVKKELEQENDGNEVIIKKEKSVVCDPRTNLMYLLATIVVVAVSDAALIGVMGIALLVLALSNKCYKSFFAGGSVLAAVYGLAIFWPNSVTLFVANFFPRFILIGIILPVIIGGEGAAHMLAALRKLRVPEKIIMVCSVIFRFFPVLKNDMKIMSQSMKTRGFFGRAIDKLKHIPAYFEVMIVPMVFRVIRIAESLSASAETRGIAMKRKRASYITLEMKLLDYGMLVLLGVIVAAGLVI